MSFVSEKRPPEQKEELTQSWYLVLLSYGEEDAAPTMNHAVHTNGDPLALAGKQSGLSVCVYEIPFCRWTKKEKRKKSLCCTQMAGNLYNFITSGR